MRLFQNARSRLIAASALLSALTIVVILALVQWTTNRIIDSETRSVVDAELNGLADSYGNLGVLGLARAIDRRIEGRDQPDALYLLTDAQGRRIAGNLGAWPPTVVPGSGWVHLDLIRTDNDRNVPIAAASIRLRGGERLLVGRDASARRDFTRILGRSLALALLAALGLSLVTGWLLTRLVFNRLAEISDTATDIISGDLTRRIPLHGTDDEFDRLGETLNVMLDRIEELVGDLRMTTDSLAHDLRSPLTRLRGHIERLADPGLEPQDKERIAERAVTEIDHLLRVFSDLTQIARAEAGLGRAQFEMVDLKALAEDVAGFHEPVGADKAVTIRVVGNAQTVFGHKALLSQAVSNLLDNALRYAPASSEIRMSFGQNDQYATLTVADAGPGIPIAERDNVRKPFVTLDASRTGGASGLGLALVSSIAHLHGGEFTLGDAAPGLLATMALDRHLRESDQGDPEQ